MLSRYKKLIEISVAFVLALVIVKLFFDEKRNFENLALGDLTVPVFATFDKYPVQTLGLRRQDEALQGYKERGDTACVLLLGNSQSHSINQLRDKEVTFAGLLFDSLHTRSVSVLTSSIPNANLEEFYLLYKVWLKNIKIKALVLPVFLDDTREEGIQTVFFPGVEKFRITDSNAIASKINTQLKQANETQNTDLTALRQTFQEKTETRLNELLEKHFLLWQSRPTIRGDIFNDLYKLRNTVFGIDALSKRKVIKDLYDENMNALKYILEDCQKENIRVLVYIPPIRNDYEIPYIRKEYGDFKEELAQLCKQHQAAFINIEDCVPGKYWGYKGTRTFFGKVDVDFMHFQYPGHLLVAKALQPQIEKLLK